MVSAPSNKGNPVPARFHSVLRFKDIQALISFHGDTKSLTEFQQCMPTSSSGKNMDQHAGRM